VVYFVQHHPSLRSLAQSYLGSLLNELAPAPGRAELGRRGAEVEQHYALLLQRILVNALLHDRRSGLVNLFWLSHSKELALTLSKLVFAEKALGPLRFALHPLLSRVLRNSWNAACQEVERLRPGHLALVHGTGPRFALVESIIEDQLPVALNDIGEVDFAQILTNNARFRLAYESFSEIDETLRKEIESRLARRDPILLAKLRRHLPSLARESYGAPAQMTKILFNGPVRRFLFADAWHVGPQLTAAPSFQAEMSRGADPLALLDTFDELASAVQRFEILSRARDHIRVLPAVMTEDRVYEQYGPVRLYRFSESVEVTGNATDAAVMFLDLRGFTRTSEGAVSERDLTEELYTVFDPFIEAIHRFDGVVDKFLGDGMMVTFGAVHSSPFAAVNALRTAVLLQERLRELREARKTSFEMGVSIHHGRVYLAYFMGSSSGPDTTVIGRNVNVAGRLSSASKRESAVSVRGFGGRTLDSEPLVDEDTGKRRRNSPSGLYVEIDEHGVLFNRGIAISQETLRAVEEVIPVQRREGNRGFRASFYDPTISKTVSLSYVGDAKFKDIQSSFPVYSVDYQ
jgi:class 3 adenylate cyclase